MHKPTMKEFRETLIEELKNKEVAQQFLEEMDKLWTVARAVQSMKAEALLYENWYTFVTYEYAERVDEALRELEKE